MSPRVLVVYYSRTGTTKRVAESLAAVVGGDLEEISDRMRRSGLLGYLRSGYEATRRREVPIAPAVRDPSTYDLVIIGTPIWNMSVSSPVRSYLVRHRGTFRNVALFCTYGGRGDARVFAQMTELCGATPIATLGIREHDVPRSAPTIARFKEDIARALEGRPPTAVTSPAGARPASSERARGPLP